MMDNKNFFTLDGTTYEVSYTDIGLEYVNNEIFLCLEVVPDDKDDEEDWGISINYFNTHVSNIEELKNKKFVWDSAHNQDAESAGCFNIIEDFVQKGTIEIVNVKEQLMTIKWYGLYGYNDSTFNITFDVEIPAKSNYVIDAQKSAKTKIDNTTQLEILNLEEFNRELIKLSKSRKQEKSSFKTKLYSILKVKKFEFNAILKLKLFFDNIDYFGEVVFSGDTRNHVTNFDSSCPKKIDFKSISWDLELKLEKFTFDIE